MTRWLPRFAASLGVAGLALAPGATAWASTPTAGASGRLVFVQTNGADGNAVVAFRRDSIGHLRRIATYPTGGRGGVLSGAMADPLASQSSLVYDGAHRMLLAVNAASDSITAFTVRGDQLTSRQTLASGGSFPVSIAVSGSLVYVANALDGGSVSGFRIASGRLDPIAASSRPLGLDPAASPQFLNSPGQVGFAPGGRRLIVTTKANGNRVEVFGVHRDGRLAATPVSTTLDGTVPFSFAFDSDGRMLLTEAATGALAVVRLDADGHVTPVAVRGTGQSAACWIVGIGSRYYVGNAGSASISGFRWSGTRLSFVVPGGVVANTDPGTIDMATAAGGRVLYAMAGANDAIDEFRVQPSGALVRIGAITGALGADAEGIAATG